MKTSIKRTMSAILALFLILTIAITLTTSIPVDAVVVTNMTAAVAASPNPAGVGQSVLINGWIEPMPDIGYAFVNLTVEVTKPNGAVSILGPLKTFGSGTIYVMYTPDTVGTYSIVLKWPGGNNTEDYTGIGLLPHTPCETNIVSPVYELVVQQEPILPYPDQPLPGPNDYWTRPISSEFREWYQISGSWLQTGGFGDTWRSDDQGNKHVNPYSTAPNSAHVAWTLDILPTGLIGDVAGAVNFGTSPSISVIMGGVGYYQRNGLHAINIQTGEEIWFNAAMTSGITFGQLPSPYIKVGTTEDPGGDVVYTPPLLWSVGSGTNGIKAFDARTGNLYRQYNGPDRGARSTVIDMERPDGGVLLYQTYSGTSTIDATFITCWNSSAPGTTFDSKLVWNQSDIEAESGSGPYLIPGEYLILCRSGNPNMKCYDAITGESLWNTTQTEFRIMSEGGIDGINLRLYYPCSTDQKVRAFDVRTGKVLWASEPRMYPWGSWSAYSAVVWDEKFYINSYDGMYCYNTANGNLVWKYIVETSETPYGTYPFYSRPYLADGKIYTQQTEHGPTQPYYRGQRMYCFDAKTGDVIWSFSGMFTAQAGSDGMVIATDGYTGTTFGFGKGKTATTLSATPTVSVDGSSVLIQGTVMDMSPAQPGTAAVSEESMIAWMEYLHTNRPIPGNATGVPVMLNAIDPNGNVQNLGTVTSDMSGMFSTMWTPPVPGKYTIIATFAGSESYWPSYTETAMGVSEAPTATAALEAAPDNTPIFAGIIAAIVVAIVIGIVNLIALRKRP